MAEIKGGIGTQIATRIFGSFVAKDRHSCFRRRCVFGLPSTQKQMFVRKSQVSITRT
jgi:hypothetical protein